MSNDQEGLRHLHSVTDDPTARLAAEHAASLSVDHHFTAPVILRSPEAQVDYSRAHLKALGDFALVAIPAIAAYKYLTRK